MDSRFEDLGEIANALPETFDFYHLGSVELSKTLTPIEDLCGVGFRLFGNLNALLVVSFPKGLDFSMYSELGNIIASQTASRLKKELGMDVMISAPFELNPNQLARITQNISSLTKRFYSHVFQEKIVPVEAWILPASEEMGHA